MVCLAPHSGQMLASGPRLDDAVAKRVDRNGDGVFSATPADNFYYLTDVMFSVRALVDSSGLLHTRLDYTPYGVAMHGKAADINGDGLLNSFDLTAFLDFYNNALEPGDAGYDPDADLMAKGAVGLNLFDVTAFQGRYNAYAAGGPTFNAGWIDNPSDPNGPDNSVGYDGYWFDLAGATEATSTGLYMVRHRVYDPKLGRWLQRDPARYIDGQSLLQYVGSNPLASTDPSGLKRIIVVFDGQNFGGLGGRGSLRSRPQWNGLLKARLPDDIVWHSEEDGDLFGHQARKIRDKIRSECQKSCKKPSVVLIGHSNGADGARKTANQLGRSDDPVKVSLLFMMDAVYKPWWNHRPDRGWSTGGNVERVINYYQRQDPGSILGVKFQGYLATGPNSIQNTEWPWLDSQKKPEYSTSSFLAHTDIVKESDIYNSAYVNIDYVSLDQGACGEN